MPQTKPVPRTFSCAHCGKRTETKPSSKISAYRQLWAQGWATLPYLVCPDCVAALNRRREVEP